MSDTASCPFHARSLPGDGTPLAPSPRIAEWREQGAVGQRKLTQATRYLTVALALMQSSGIVFLLHSGQLFSSSASSRVNCS